MKKFILLILACFIFSGCSLLPRVTFDTPNTLPQSTDKSKAKYKCSGKIEYYEDGTVKSCSKGYYSYQQNFEKKERKMTIVEKVRSFFNAILGWGIPGVIVLCLLFPSLFTVIGTIIGRAIEGAFGASVTVLKRVGKAIQKTRKQGANLDHALSEELDEKDKIYIRKMKDKENIK